MRDKFELCKAKGFVKAWVINPDNTRELIYDNHNLILANAKQILAHLLGGDSAMVIDTIFVIGSAIVLASESPLQVNFPAVDEVEFSAVFSESSFSGAFDTLTLESAGGGAFATLSGLSLSKTNLQKFAIEWKITFKDCA